MNKPLTIEELKALEAGDWVWIKLFCDLDSPYRKGKYVEVDCKDEEELYFVADCEDLDYSTYGIEWIAYKNKEQVEEYEKCWKTLEKQLADCCCECTRYEIDFDKLKGKS